MRRLLFLAAALTLTPLAAAGAETPRFGLPLDCRLGETCWLMNYVDTRPGPGTADFRCGARTYDGHDGTDFAVRDHAASAHVVAPAAGVVVAVRDGEADGVFLARGEAAVAGRECGNGVLLRHGDGWESQLCHMEPGSIAVRPGQRVEEGAVLGRVGLSGQTAFPHVHLTIRHDGKALDPFTGTAPRTCGEAGTPLWATAVEYRQGALYAVGFRTGLPSKDDLKADASSPASLPASSPALVLWGSLFGVEPGDRLRMVLTGPDGKVAVERVTDPFAKPQAWRFEAVGVRTPASGAWHGQVDLLRDGKAVETRDARVTVGP